MNKLIFILSILLLWLNSSAQKPIYNWDFEGKDPFVEKIDKQKINYTNYKCSPTIESINGNKVLSLAGNECLLPVNGLKGINDQFSLSFNFKGSYFSYIGFPAQHFRFIFDYDYLQFTTTTSVNGKYAVDDWIIPLNGQNVPTYDELADDNWHNVILRSDAKSGIKEIVIDGQSFPGLKKKNNPSEKFVMAESDGLRKFWLVDDLQFYDRYMPDQSISFLQNQPTLKNKQNKIPKDVTRNSSKNKKVNFKEFAPGYPEYTVNLLEQLQSFPLPRFSSGHNLTRNFSWMDINYLHRQYQYPLTKGFGKSDIKYAADIVYEMARFWNYNIEIPTLKIPENDARKKYENNRSIEGALINLANQNSEIPTSTIMFHTGINPSHFGYKSSIPYALSQNLPDSYYLKSENGKPVIFKGKKWFAPYMPLDKVEIDGKVAGKYLLVVNSYLKKPLSFINENGEIYGHMRPLELWKMDPHAERLYKTMKLSNADFNGWFQNRIDSTYKANLLKESGNPTANFTMYDLSASASEYWPAYKFRMNINSKFNNSYRSTPAFYPATPKNWVNGGGSYMGYGMVANGRKTEIELGVLRFAPFIAAGWSEEESNIRPAQWLSLLKSMVMLGADFFHTGYFNITDNKGQWPNGMGPFNPAGYAYQIVMPSYAQALFPLVEKYIDEGQLIEGNYAEKFKQYRIKGSSENHLIIVRKLDNSYLIYGSIQPNSNNDGNVRDIANTQINLNGKVIKFPIRRQGSIYKLNLGRDTTFIQIDGWHQNEHPYYWSGSIDLEAELGTLSSAQTNTDSKSKFDFSSFTSYVSMNNSESKISLALPIRKTGKYRIIVRARAKSSNSLLRGFLSNTNARHSIRINSGKWEEYSFMPSVNLSGQNKFDEYIHTLNISSQGLVDIDYIKAIPL